MLQESLIEKLTLGTEVASGGKNLSAGQRQIIALARAIVRKSKLLIMDEGMRSIEFLWTTTNPRQLTIISNILNRYVVSLLSTPKLPHC